MIRKIIQIDQELCNGCGACADACHEGAIAMADGKAKLTRDDYCDGLGDCLPACPTGAITFVEREAAAYDAAAAASNKLQRVMQSAQEQAPAQEEPPLPWGCPGSQSRQIEHQGHSRLSQWPVQIKLIPQNAPYFHKAKLLIAADCTAYAYASFHERFIQGHITLVGCPKLDNIDYSEKLTQILSSNDIRSITVVRMEVPCCGGIEHAAKAAMQRSGKWIPWKVVTISTDGRIIEET